MKLSILIPVYNEQATLREILTRVGVNPVEVDVVDGRLGLPVIEGKPGIVRLEKEIVVVDDGSSDGSRDILARLPPSPNLVIVMHDVNKGKGAAIRTAIEHATGDILLIQDADLEYDPRDYPSLIRPILEDKARVVYGSRFMGGPRTAMRFWSAIANKGLTLITNIFYNAILTDMETGYKVFRADIIRAIPLRSRRFDFEPEVTAKVLKRGHRIFEVPISYAGREFSEGKKISWRDGFVALWTLIKYRFVD